jgi:hypothetical protein
MWERHGMANHLLFEDPKYEAETYQEALPYCKAYGVAVGSQLPQPPGGKESLTGEKRKQYEAAEYMFEYKFYRDLSNFAHHLNRPIIEKQLTTIAARKLFFMAETSYLRGDLVKAREIYERPAAIAAWRDEVLLGCVRDAQGRLLPKSGEIPAEHRIFREHLITQEYTYETQLRYLQFYNEQYGSRIKQNVARHQILMGRLGEHVLAASGGPIMPDLTCWLIGDSPLIFDSNYMAPYLFAGGLVGSCASPRVPAALLVAADAAGIGTNYEKLRSGGRLFDEHLFNLGGFGSGASPLAPPALLTTASIGFWSRSLRPVSVTDQPMVSFSQIGTSYAELKGPFDILVFDVDEKDQPHMGARLVGTAGAPMSPGPLLAMFEAGTVCKPLLSEQTKQIVRERRGLNPPPKKPPEAEPEKK